MGPHGCYQNTLRSAQLLPTKSEYSTQDTCDPYEMNPERIPYGRDATRFFDRHRGRGRPRTPATPPCVRVRTRRFESVALASINQRWKSERFEVGIREPHREGFALR